MNDSLNMQGAAASADTALDAILNAADATSADLPEEDQLAAEAADTAEAVAEIGRAHV